MREIKLIRAITTGWYWAESGRFDDDWNQAMVFESYQPLALKKHLQHVSKLAPCEVVTVFVTEGSEG